MNTKSAGRVTHILIYGRSLTAQSPSIITESYDFKIELEPEVFQSCEDC